MSIISQEKKRPKCLDSASFHVIYQINVYAPLMYFDRPDIQLNNVRQYISKISNWRQPLWGKNSFYDQISLGHNSRALLLKIILQSATTASLQSLQKCRISGPTPDLLRKKSAFLPKSPGDSDAH